MEPNSNNEQTKPKLTISFQNQNLGIRELTPYVGFLDESKETTTPYTDKLTSPSSLPRKPEAPDLYQTHYAYM